MSILQGKFDTRHICFYSHLFFYRINPNFTDALVKLSHILSTIAAETTEAEALLKRAVQLKPTDVDILNNYAVCLNSLCKT